MWFGWVCGGVGVGVRVVMLELCADEVVGWCLVGIGLSGIEDRVGGFGGGLWVVLVEYLDQLVPLLLDVTPRQRRTHRSIIFDRSKWFRRYQM